MGATTSRTDFHWSEEDEPHGSRRRAILEVHPEIKKLFGVNPWFKYQVLALVILQMLSMALLLCDSPFQLHRLPDSCSGATTPWWLIVCLAYLFGGVINHALMLAVHEIAHSAGFGIHRPVANKMLALFANLPIGVPFAVAFKGYHLEHHKFQGLDRIDTDIPTVAEATLFNTSAGKLIWLFFQPIFYALRPVVTNPKSLTAWELVNIVVQVSFNCLVFRFYGIKGLVYLVGGSLLAMGCHPVAGHFISEHYMFRHGFETYSYYGPLNWLTFNVGYHNEHHDFPYVPGTNLPDVKRLAPEFYDTLPHHTSWVRVLYDFVCDPNISLYARIKRRKEDTIKKM